MPHTIRTRKVLHAAAVGLEYARQERIVRRLPTHVWEGPFRRPSLLRRLVNRIRRTP